MKRTPRLDFTETPQAPDQPRTTRQQRDLVRNIKDAIRLRLKRLSNWLRKKR